MCVSVHVRVNVYGYVRVRDMEVERVFDELLSACCLYEQGLYVSYHLNATRQCFTQLIKSSN